MSDQIDADSARSWALEVEGRRPGDPAAEHRDRVRGQVPPVVYLPVTSVESATAYDVEMRTTNDGRVALLAYTALDRLATCCGPDQPWVLYPTDRLEELAQSQPYSVIYLDLRIPEESWHTPLGGGSTSEEAS